MGCSLGAAHFRKPTLGHRIAIQTGCNERARWIEVRPLGGGVMRTVTLAFVDVANRR